VINRTVAVWWLAATTWPIRPPDPTTGQAQGHPLSPPLVDLDGGGEVRAALGLGLGHHGRDGPEKRQVLEREQLAELSLHVRPLVRLLAELATWRCRLWSSWTTAP